MINPLFVLSSGVCLVLIGIIGNVIAFRKHKDWLMFISTTFGICAGLGLMLTSVGHLMAGGQP